MIELITPANVISVIMFVLSIIEAVVKRKFSVVVINFVQCALLCFLYFFLEDWVALSTGIILAIRSFIFIFYEKIQKYKWHHLIPWLAVVVQIAISIPTFNNLTQILIICASCFYTAFIWYMKDRQIIRLGNIATLIIWILYNFINGYWLANAQRFVSLISNVIVYILVKTGKKSDEK